MRLHPQHRCDPAARLVHLLARKAACLIGRIGLHLALGVIAGEPVNHLLAGIRAARIFEKRLPLKRCGGECGKLGAHPVDIERFGHQSLVSIIASGKPSTDRGNPNLAGLPAEPMPRGLRQPGPAGPPRTLIG